ncbi:MAG: hypothetical protein MUC53_09245 [Candidatus Contendobacter sp.]|nr:hypothetical protein [Candidatus Contendobacter sp.]
MAAAVAKIRMAAVSRRCGATLKASSQQAIDRFGVVAGMVFGGVADVDVGDAEGAHAQIADDDEAGGPDAVFIQADVAEDDRRQSDPAEHVEQLGGQLHDGVLGQAVLELLFGVAGGAHGVGGNGVAMGAYSIAIPA